MTKAQEIALLDKTIAAFGPHSYLGPWLAENRASIIADINNDFQPMCLMPGAARAEAAKLLADAKADADKLKADALQYAEGARVGAREQVERYRADARRAIERIAGQL